MAALLREEPVQDYFGLVLVMTLMLFSVKIPILLWQEALDGDDTLLGAADAEVLVGRDSGLGFGLRECDVTYIWYECISFRRRRGRMCSARRCCGRWWRSLWRCWCGSAWPGLVDGALLGADVDVGLFDLWLDDPLRACGALAQEHVALLFLVMKHCLASSMMFYFLNTLNIRYKGQL